GGSGAAVGSGGSSRVPAAVRLCPALAAVLDERRVPGAPAAVPLLRPDPAAGPASAPELDGHHGPIFPALLYVPGQHGALLDLDELLPAAQPGARATVAAGVNAIL